MVSRRQVSTECVLLVSSWVEHLTCRQRGLLSLVRLTSVGWERGSEFAGRLHAVGS